ncbi:unnamed protein product [Camellia sinensis]
MLPSVVLASPPSAPPSVFASPPLSRAFQWKKELCNSVQLIGIVVTPVQIKAPSSGKAVAWSRLAVKKSSTDTACLAGVQCAGNPQFCMNEDGSYQEEGQKNTRGYIWGKAGTKLVCAVLSFHVPSKSANPCGEQVNNLVSRAVPDYTEQRTLQKPLLIGYSGSGTSTIFKQVLSALGSATPYKKITGMCLEKALHLERDEEDMAEFVRNCPAEFKEYYVQIQAAKRSQTPLPSQVNDDRIILDKTLTDQVSIWKSSRGLTDKVVLDHDCSGETCTYYQIGDVFVCEKTGQVHEATLRYVEQQQGGISDEVESFMGSGRFDGRNLQLHFRSRLSLPLFTGGKVEGEQGAAIHIVLLDMNTGHVVTSGPESTIKLDVVVLEGDFNNEDDEGWTEEEFESHVMKEREGKRPLLTGDLQVTLKEGVGTLGELTFTDNSSWIRSRKFRLGLKVASGFCEGIHVGEAKTEAFTVKDHRGEYDDVWRLEKIGKDGSFHKRLNKSGIFTVEDFVRLVVRDSQKLRILSSGMSNKMWDALIEHAKTCAMSGKLYVYYADDTRNVGVVFNSIYELSGLITGEQYLLSDSLSDSQKVYIYMWIPW